MAVQLSTPVRNAMLDSLESTVGVSPTLQIRSGAQPANCAAAATGTVLATLALPADFMAAASAGSKTILGTWQDLSADAAGTAGHFRIVQGATCHVQGSITPPAGGGDMIIDNAVLALGQQVSISAFTLTDNNG
jgi:hypothetical protein